MKILGFGDFNLWACFNTPKERRAAWDAWQEVDKRRMSEVDELEQRLAAAEALNKKLAKFFVGAIQCTFDGCDYDGGGMQDDALALGLIMESKPPEGEEGPWYRIVDDVKKLIEVA